MEREEFMLMTEDLQKNPQIKAVVLANVSRLGRNLEDMVVWYGKLKKKGIKLFVKEGEIDTTTKEGRMNFYLQCMFAEFELDTITERMNTGLKAYIKAGGKIGRGHKKSK
jgi:DNA invertase Pin-like site-specific DNA recombinase